MVLAACQPPQPSTGPGSTERYVATSVQVFEQGEQTPTGSTKVTWFVPDVLAHGASAPVVVYLHGFSAGVPALYRGHIDHLVLQGNIVVFPAFNTSNLVNDLEQNAMVDRIVANVDAALAELGALADTSELYVYGHSAGAAFGSVWEYNGGIPPKGIVLAHPSIDLSAIPVPVEVTPVDWAVEAPATTAPVVLLTGDADTIAAPSEAVELFGYLTGAASRVVWEARSDATMYPPITASHTAPLALSGAADTLDWRFSWAALDQVMAGHARPTFDLGEWSNGTPVLAPVVLAG
jgi:alpha-beta hydrolase superfamily lysophospholipase